MDVPLCSREGWYAIRVARLKVIFRTLPGYAIAVFPEVPSDSEGKFCVAYERRAGWGNVGEQFSVDLVLTLAATEAAPLKRFAHALEPVAGDSLDLFNELLDIGYRLSVMNDVNVSAAAAARLKRLARLNLCKGEL